MRRWDNISDEELDRVFREAADTVLPVYEEDQWLKMENLLNKRSRRKLAFWKKYLLLSGLLLVVSFSVLKYAEKSNGTRETETKDKQMQRVSGHLNETNSFETNIPIARKNAPLSEETKPPKVQKPALERALNQAGFFAIKRQSESLTGKGETKSKANKSLPDNAERNNDEPGQMTDDKVLLPDESAKEQIMLEQLEPRTLLVPEKYASVILSPRKVSNSSATVPAKGLGIRLAFSPDFSYTTDNGPSQIGHNLGLLIEYRFDSRWSVQAGVLKSQKYYSSGADTYPWPILWGDRPLQLNRVDASCHMIDFPINLRYNLTQGRSAWFAQMGFSGFWMLNEKYDYTYQGSYSGNEYRSWLGKTGVYPLGELNVSGGLEHQFTRRLNIQVEPFVKIPLQGVGYGSVKLRTFGVFISSSLPLTHRRY